MKIFDPSALSNTVGDFTLSSDIPEHLYPETNVDGTRPQVSVSVKAPTQILALQVLKHLHDEGSEDILDSIIGQLVAIDPDFNEETELDLEDPAELASLKLKMTENHSPFIEFPFGMDVSSEVDGKEVQSSVDIVITAPSGTIAMHSFLGLTSEKMLSRLATSFMPDEEDDYGFDDYDS
jgi:hypothetical protein